jgi:hypothetical protein
MPVASHLGLYWEPPIITLAPTILLNPTYNQSYSATLTASGGTDPYTFTIASGALPSGITLSSGGVISGTTYSPGTYNFTVNALDKNAYVGSQTYTFVIATPIILITPTSLQGGYGPITYNTQYSATGGSGTYTYAVTSGSLPTGTSLSSSGLLTGTCSTTGTYTATITATDSHGQTGSVTVSSSITVENIVLSPTVLPSPSYGALYSQTITASGGTAPYTFSISSGSLPSGITLSSSGVLTGTATSYGNYSFAVRAADGIATGTQVYSFSIATPVIVILPSTVPNATAPASYSTTFTASGGITPYTFTVLSGSLPTGLSLSSSGVLSGVASVAGTYNFVIRATDSASAVGTQSYTVTIAPLDRAIARTPPTVLIVYDLAEGPFFSPGYGFYGGYYSYPQNGGGDVNPVTIAQSVAARESALGFLTQVITSYAQLNSLTRDQINKFSHIWDVGYHSSGLGSAQSKYIQYLQDGGALFLLGENVYFLNRDQTEDNLINAAGGGGGVNVRSDTAGLGTYTETTSAEFLLANSRSDVTFYAPNYFTNYGTGTPIANGPYGPSAVVWKTGSLSNAPAGAIVSVLDINFIVNPAYGVNYGSATWQPWFVDNLSLVLNKK